MKRLVIASAALLVALLVAVLIAEVVAPETTGDGGSAAAELTDPNGCALRGIVVLEAQAVPTATKVPCVADQLVGWSQSTQEVENGSSKLSYATTSTEGATWTIQLQAACTPPPEATPARFDQPGVARSRTDRLEGSLAVHEEWFVFPGGCASYEVTIPERFDEQRLFRELEVAFRLIDRSAIDEAVRVRSHGAFGLDPKPPA